MAFFRDYKATGTLTYKQRFLFISTVPIYFMIFALIFSPVKEILPGLWQIIIQPDLLITDYIVVGGIGAAFFNAGILTLILLFLLLPYIRFFTLWQKCSEYMADTYRFLYLCQTAWLLIEKIHLLRSLWYQPVTCHHIGNADRSQKYPVAAALCNRHRTCYRICTSSYFTPCKSRTQGLFSL